MTMNDAALHQVNGWPSVVDAMRRAVAGDTFWEDRLAGLPSTPKGLHLAIFIEPFLGHLLAGRNTV